MDLRGVISWWTPSEMTYAEFVALLVRSKVYNDAYLEQLKDEPPPPDVLLETARAYHRAMSAKYAKLIEDNEKVTPGAHVPRGVLPWLACDQRVVETIHPDTLKARGQRYGYTLTDEDEARQWS